LIILISRQKFSWNLWNIVSRRIIEKFDFWTCPRKIELNKIPRFWIVSSLQNFSIPSLSSRSEPRLHKVSLEPHSETTRKDLDPNKISGPHLTSLTSVPNFRIISPAWVERTNASSQRFKLLSHNKPNDSDFDLRSPLS
jgi:hypothetical protein